MDFTALVTGSAQAGHSSPVSKPGIGLTAGAGASPTCDAPAGGGDDFAALVALALLGGEAPEGSATGTSGNTTRSTGDEGEEAVVEAASPGDAPVDAATLAVLIALAAPPLAVAAAQPAPALGLDGTGQAGADLAAVHGASTGTSLRAAETTFDGAPPRTTNAAGTAGEFQDILGTAAATPEPAAVPAASTASAASADPAPASSTAVPAAGVAAITAPEVQPTATADAAPAASPAPAAPAAPAAPPAPTAVPAASPHASAPPTNHPLRQALAAIAAESTTPATASAQATSSPAIATAEPTVVAQASPVAAESAPASHESRTVAAGPTGAPTPAAMAAPVGSDSGSTGDPSSGGSQDGSAVPVFTGPEVRLDASALAAVQSATAGTSAEALASGALTAVAGFGAGSSGEPGLRAIDLPAAARFEQTLASLDPDVRNLQAMVRTVRLFTAGSGATEARLTLEPEHLGPVALTVRVEHGSVSAHFRADTPAAHRWIETHQQELRSGLREQGLEVKEVVVTTDPDGRRERQQYEPPAKPRARRQAPADGPRFEVLA